MRGYTKLHGHWGMSGKRVGLLLEGARIQTDGFKELDGGGPTGFQKNELMLKARAHNDPGARVYHEVAIKGGFSNELSHETYLGLSDADFRASPYRRYAASQKGRMKWWRTQAEASYFLARGDLVDFEAKVYRHDLSRAWRKFNRFRGGPDIADILRNPDAGQSAVYFGVLRGDEDSLGPDQTLMVGTNNRTFVSQGLATVTHIRPKTKWVDQDIEFGARIHNDSIRRNHTEDGFVMVGGTLVPERTPTETSTLNRGAAVAGALYLLDEITVAKRLTLIPGSRLEIIRTDFRDDLANTRTDATDIVVLPGGGAHVQATPWLGVLAGVHVGFSPVSPGQSPDVDPEQSINYEAGVRIAHRGTRVEAIGFFNDYKNLTGECTFSSGCADVDLGRQFNGGAVHVAGLEGLAGHRHRLPRSHFIEANANYTFTWSRFRTSFLSASPQFGQVETGDQLPYVPMHQFSTQLGAGGRIWATSVTGTYVGHMRDVPGRGSIATEERIPHYFVLDLSARVWVTPRASFYSTLNNVAATHYMLSRRPFGARPGLPLNFMAGFKYDFG
jgi:Fe(3+) dicitrate transport protein